jgi:hypothetical protein
LGPFSFDKNDILLSKVPRFSQTLSYPDIP